MKTVKVRMPDSLYKELDIFAQALELPIPAAIRVAIHNWIVTEACDEESAQKIRDKFGHNKKLIQKILG